VKRIAFVVVALVITLLPASKARAQPDLARLARQGYDISADQASQLEESLTRDPNDLAAWAQLLGFYFAAGGRHSQVSPEVARQARLRHILWLVQNHPELELAGLSPATIDPTGDPLADREGYEKVKALWLEQTEKHKDNPEVLANASWFFKLPDKPIAAQLLKRAQTVDPGNRNWSAGLGIVYAAGIVGLTGMNESGFATRADPDETHGLFAQHAREELAKSQDAALIGTAGDRLWFWGTILSAAGKAPPDYRGLSEQLLRKAQALDPGNQQWTQLLARVNTQPAPKAASPENHAGEKSYPLRVTLQYVRKSSSGTTIAEQALITDSESQDKYRADFECDGTLGWVRFNARWDKNEHKEMKLPTTQGGNDGHEVNCKVQKLTKQPQ
jgi:hypothetical protein